MAATLRASAVTNQTASGLSHVLNLPTGIKVDQLLHIALAVTETNTGVTISGWTEYASKSWTSGTMRSFWRKATGSETATVTATSSQSARISARATRYSDWHGTTAPEALTASGFSASADVSGSLSPSWGSANDRWVGNVFCIQGVSSYPANLPDDGANGYLNAPYYISSSQDSTAASFDPDAFALNGTNFWVETFFAIRPGTAGPDTTLLAIEQDPAPLTLSGGDQTVGLGQPLAIYQHPAVLTISGGEQTIGNVIERYILLAGPNGEETPDRLDDDISGMTRPIVGLGSGVKPFAFDLDPLLADAGGSLLVDLAVSGATDVDRADAETHDLTMVGDATLTPIHSDPTLGDAIDLRILIRQDGTGGWALAWGGTITWATPGGAEPDMPQDPGDLLTVGLLSVDDAVTWLGYVVDTSTPVIALDDLSDVTLTAPASGEILRYDGAAWVDGGDALDDRSDVTITSGAEGDVIRLRSGVWVNEALPATGGEVLMADGVTFPPDPLYTDTGDDWLYEG